MHITIRALSLSVAEYLSMIISILMVDRLYKLTCENVNDRFCAVILDML